MYVYLCISISKVNMNQNENFTLGGEGSTNNGYNKSASLFFSQIFKSRLPTSWMGPLFKRRNVSKVTALFANICSLHNQEHPGFPVNFLKQEHKAAKAAQIIQNFDRECFMHHLPLPTSVSKCFNLHAQLIVRVSFCLFLYFSKWHKVR